jgi:murein DD-endopeptidase MepM/ murein hydrolase activator NlpD
MPSALSAPNTTFSGVDTITDPGALERRAKTNDPESIRAVAREFESLFMHQLFKSMRATIPKEEGSLSDAGMGGEMFTDMLDQEYAQNAAATGGIGLADLVAEQFGIPREGPVGGQRSAHPPTGSAPTMPTMHQALGRAMRAYGAQSATAGLTMPVQGGVVSSEYGMRKLADDKAARMHDGLDIAAAMGTPIQASLGGTVAHAGWIKGYGNSVILDHGDGTTTLYAHASELLVKEGEKVARGAEIAKVGSTGHSTGPHLHFEVRRAGRTVDPREALGLR